MVGYATGVPAVGLDDTNNSKDKRHHALMHELVQHAHHVPSLSSAVDKDKPGHSSGRTDMDMGMA